MSVESATYISQLDSTKPAAGDAKSEGDDHIRVVKVAVLGSFPSLGAAAVTATAAQINDVVNKAVKTGETYSGTHTFSSATVVFGTPTFSTPMNDLLSALPSGEWLYKPPQAENLGKGKWRIAQEWHWAEKWSIVYGGTANGTT